MSDFETVFLIFLIIGFAVIWYTAGKGDLINIVALTLQQKSKELTEQLKQNEEKITCRNCEKKNTRECSLWQGTVGGTDFWLERGEDFYCSYGVNK